MHLSFAPDEEVALRIAYDQWRSNVFPPPLCWDIETAEQFDLASEHVPPDAMRRVVLVSSDLKQHTGWLHEFVDLGFDELYLHHVGKEQQPFIDAFGAHVLPELGG